MLFKLHFSGCSSMWKSFLSRPIRYTALNKDEHTHESYNTPIFCLFLGSNLNCSSYVAFVIMTESCGNVCRNMRSGSSSERNKKLATTIFNRKNNHAADICENAKQEGCQEKSTSSASWKRRDSFSSCSSDSAVYCSSRHTQMDSIAQDTINKKLIEESIGKKRHRHSSGSSALSSASDNSSKNVNELLTCLRSHDPELKESLTKVSMQSSIGYPTTITSQSEIKTILEEKTLTYTCKSEKSIPKNEGFHNLRRHIRKRTCHNCDCEGSHVTIYQRRYVSQTRMHIEQAATTTTTTTKYNSPKAEPSSHHKTLCERILEQEPKPIRSSLPETSPTLTDDLPTETEFATPKSASNKKRRREVDKLYDALHEIKWAKHMSPDNILSQIDFRRAATVSFYSNKKKVSHPNSSKVFKAPSVNKKSQFNKDGCMNITPLSQNCFHRTRSRVIYESAKLPKNSPSTEKKSSNCKVNNHRHLGSVRHFLRSKKNEMTKNGYLVCQNNQIDTEEKVEHDSGKVSELESVSIVKDKSATKVDALVEPLIAQSEKDLESQMPSTDGAALTSDINIEDGVCTSEQETHVEENTIQEEIAPLSPCYLSESPSVVEQIVVTSLEPYIVDIENMEVCYEEVISDNNFEITSPSLPQLTKIAPVPEHVSDDSPPDLDLCADVSCSGLEEESKNLNSSLLEPVEVDQQITAVKIECKEVDEKKDLIVEDKNSLCEETELSQKLNSVPVVKTLLRRKPLRNQERTLKYSILKKWVFGKYFLKSKPRLKLASCLSILRKRNSLKCSQNAHVVEETCVHPNITKETSNSVNAFSKEDCKEILKNDSLRVHVTGLDHFAIRNQLQQYKSIFNSSHQAITEFGLTMNSSQVKEESSGSCMKVTQKKIHHKHYNNGKCFDSNSKLSLEYKSNCHSDISIPFNFTVHYRYITVTRNDGYTQVIFKLTKGQNVYLTVEALRELRDTFHRAASDNKCQVLIMNSVGKSFCLGLDLRPLLSPMKVIASKEIANGVKEFIEALVSFNKPLVVVVNGETAGLGVTMLAYCDIVIASDAATFHMPCSQLGFSPEGAATLMLPFVVGSTVAMDMMLRGRKLSAQEACGHGLVTEVLKASRLPFKLVERVRQLAESPSSVMESTKSMLRMHLYQRLGLALENETLMLPRQWLSEPCQTALKNAFMNGFMD